MIPDGADLPYTRNGLGCCDQLVPTSSLVSSLVGGERAARARNSQESAEKREGDAETNSSKRAVMNYY